MIETRSDVFSKNHDQDRLSRYRRILIQSYPGVDLFSVDLNDHEDVDRSVKVGTIGDTLFSFLWRELSDDCDDPILRISNAVQDLLVVKWSFKEGAAADLAPESQSIQPSP